MENAPGSGMPTKIKIGETGHRPYRLLLTIMILFIAVCVGLVYAPKFIGNKKPLTEQEVKSSFEAEYNKHPQDFVYLSGEWHLLSKLTQDEKKTWENEQHEYSRKHYAPDVIDANGFFFRVNDRYYESKRVFAFYENSTYPDLPVTRVEMTDNHFLLIHCSPKDFAAMMQRTRR